MKKINMKLLKYIFFWLIFLCIVCVFSFLIAYYIDMADYLGKERGSLEAAVIIMGIFIGVSLALLITFGIQDLITYIRKH